MIEAPEDQVFAGGLERAWIDDRVPADAPVTKLYVDTPCGSALERHALFLTEFFNSTVDRAAYVRGSVPDGLPIERVDVNSAGELESRPASRLSRTTSSRSRASGSPAAHRRGDAAHLVLWHVGGPVHVVGARSAEQLRRNVCA